MAMQKEVNEKNQKRTVYMDYLRILATFAVIVIHVASQNWYSAAIQSFEWKVLNFYDSIARWAVPVFAMISGALFLDRRYSVKKLYTQNILRIVTAFLGWSLIYAVIYNENGSEKTMLYDTISGPFHFWFLPMIVGIYMCIPIIYKVIEDMEIVKYFLFLSLILAFMVPQMLSMMLDFGSDFWSNIAYSIRYTLSNMQLRVIGGYLFYFICGFYLNQKALEKKSRWVIYIMGVVGYISTIILTEQVSLLKQSPTGTYYDYFSANVMLESIAIFVWFKYNVNHIIQNEKLQNVVSYLSKCSFGVFLVHILVRDKLCAFVGLDILIDNPIISVPIISVFIFAVSSLISLILNKIPYVNKYFV